MTDMNFIDHGFYVTLVPNNVQAEDAWKLIDQAFPGCAVPVTAWHSVRKQLKDAGYSIRKLRKMKPLTDAELDKMLEELAG